MDHDKIILLSTPFPTIPMLGKNCCCGVIVFYVGNKRCCIVLYCIVLYCIVLYCIVLYCIVLYCIILYCIVLYCIVLYCIVLYCISSSANAPLNATKIAVKKVSDVDVCMVGPEL